MDRSILRGLFAATLVLLALACGPAPSAPPQAGQPGKSSSSPSGVAQPTSYPIEKLRVGYASVNPPVGVVWLAKEAGIFDKYGLDVELVFLEAGSTQIAAMVAGDIPIAATTGTPVAAAFLAGSDVVYFASSQETLSYQLIGGPGTARAEDVRGKRLGISRYGSSSDLVTRMIVKKLGIDPEKDVSILQVGNESTRLAAVKGGSIDAAIMNAPFGLEATRLGLNLILDTTDLNIYYADTGLATTRRYLRESPDIVRRYIRAYAESIKLYKTDAELAKRVIQKYTKTEDMEALEEAYQYHSRKLLQVPYPTEAGMRTVLEELALQDPKAKDVRPSDVMDPTWVKELEDSGFIRRLYP